MKVFNLQCHAGHSFEGWFGSEDDFLSQSAGGLLLCPVCATQQVQRMPSAPRLNLSGAQAPRRVSPVPAREVSGSSAPHPVAVGTEASRVAPIRAVSPLPVGAESSAQAQAMEAMYLQAVKHVLANTEDVGKHFADEARRIHYGDIEHRNIRGKTTPEQAQELVEEGIEVFALPVPEGLTGPVH